MGRNNGRVAIATGVMWALALGAAAAMPARSAPKSSTEWCAVYRTGSENCHFTNEQQCLNNVSGLGGFCRMSFYPPEGRRG